MVQALNSILDGDESDGLMDAIVSDVLSAGRQRYGIDDLLSRSLLSTLSIRYAMEHELASIDAYPDIPSDAWEIHDSSGWYSTLQQQRASNLQVLYVSNLMDNLTQESPDRFSTFYDGLTKNLQRAIIEAGTVNYAPVDSLLSVYFGEYGAGSAYSEHVLLSALEHAASSDRPILLHMGWIRLVRVSFIVDAMHALRIEHDAPDHWLGFLLKDYLPSVDMFVTAVHNLGTIPYNSLSVDAEC